MDCSSQTNQRHLTRHQIASRVLVQLLRSLDTSAELNTLDPAMTEPSLLASEATPSELMGAVSWWEHSLLLSPDNSGALETLLTPEMSEKVILEAPELEEISISLLSLTDSQLTDSDSTYDSTYYA